MKFDIIPFYTRNVPKKQNYTLFLSKEKNIVYKAYHKETNQNLYFPIFFSILIFFRSIDSIRLSSFPSLILLLISVIAGIAIGLYIHKKLAYENVKEVFLTDTQLEKYIKKGRKTLNTELWITFIALLCFIGFSILFLVTNLLIMFLFSFAAYVFAVIYICRLPLERFRLIKRRK